MPDVLDEARCIREVRRICVFLALERKKEKVKVNIHINAGSDHDDTNI